MYTFRMFFVFFETVWETAIARQHVQKMITAPICYLTLQLESKTIAPMRKIKTNKKHEIKTCRLYVQSHLFVILLSIFMEVISLSKCLFFFYTIRSYNLDNRTQLEINEKIWSMKEIYRYVVMLTSRKRESPRYRITDSCTVLIRISFIIDASICSTKSRISCRR